MTSLEIKSNGTQFRTRPEIATVNDYFVDTGPVSDAEQVGRLSFEASQVLGRFSWQSELLTARVHMIFSLRVPWALN